MKTSRLLIAASAAVLLLSGSAVAQLSLELNVGYGTYVSSWADAPYIHAYTPRFLYGTAVTSARQTLSLGADAVGSGSFGLTLFSGRFGVQIQYHAFDPAVSGWTSTHEASVTYTSMQPPDYTPTSYTQNYSTLLSDPSGELNEKAFSLNAVYRLPLPSWFSLDLSAGLTWFNVQGEIGVLGYSKYWLGGHSVLFSEFYQMAMHIETFNRIGGNAAATLNWHMGSNAALWIEARWFLAPETEAVLSFTPIDAADAITAFDPAEDVFPAGRLLIKPAFFRFAAGFRIAI
jgi:hypothetical protein